MNFKTPKIEKIYEALSVLADNRIEYSAENSAKIYSSDRSKYYSLTWSSTFGTFYSDDNASKWQHTLGYPIIAILLDKNVLDKDGTNYSFLSNVNWSKLNKEYKRDYAAAVEHVLENSGASQPSKDNLVETVGSIYSKLIDMDIEKSTKKDIEGK